MNSNVRGRPIRLKARLVRDKMISVQNVFYPRSKMAEKWEKDPRIYGGIAYVCELYELKMVPATGLMRLFSKEEVGKHFLVRAVFVVNPLPGRYEFTILHSLGEDRDKQISWMLSI